MLKINLGCGDNKLNGWDNRDIETDIAKPLPFEKGSVDFILCEHCVEHLEYYEGIEFFKECKRVLKNGGVARIIVPSLEQIWKCDDKDYYHFTQKWQDIGATARGAMHAILYAHGHETAWTASLLEATLFYCGFNILEKCKSGVSHFPELCGVDGHQRVIGEKFNGIESLIVEGTA